MSWLLLVLLLAIVVGGVGHQRFEAPWAWSPAAVLLVVVAVLIMTGRMRL